MAGHHPGPPIPDGCKIQIELHTAGENLARVTFMVKGITTTEVRDLALKELARHHWAVEGIGRSGVRVTKRVIRAISCRPVSGVMKGVSPPASGTQEVASRAPAMSDCNSAPTRSG